MGIIWNELTSITGMEGRAGEAGHVLDSTNRRDDIVLEGERGSARRRSGGDSGKSPAQKGFKKKDGEPQAEQEAALAAREAQRALEEVRRGDRLVVGSSARGKAPAGSFEVFDTATLSPIARFAKRLSNEYTLATRIARSQEFRRKSRSHRAPLECPRRDSSGFPCANA